MNIAKLTAEEAAKATAFITHRALRASAAARLMDGRTYICPTCENIADTDSGCYPCDTARYEKFIAEAEVMMGNAEASTGCDPYARF